MTVYLVGAGCGTPGFLSLRAREVLGTADHLVYDRLLHPDLLQLCPRGCVFHPAGKRESDHTLRQSEINELLVRLGREGGNVVRLKGGDPFVFGRGGEEALALQEAGIAWEVLPGATSGLAGTAAEGLPLTHRGLSRALTLVTGHSRKSSLDRELWGPIARTQGTLGIYMGASNLPHIAELLEEEGVAPDTPAAAVTWGGWGRGRRFQGTLASLVEAGKKGEIPSPSIVLVGPAASLDLKPHQGELKGLQVAVCRPFPNSWTTARLLENMGADAYSLPLLRSVSLDVPGFEEDLKAADRVVLTSPRGVSNLLRLAGDLRRIRGKIVAIGPGTAAALKNKGLIADLVPEEPTSRGLARILQEAVRPGEKVLFARNERASNLPVDAVANAGGEAIVRSTYRMESMELPGEELYREMWNEAPLHAVVFGSGALAEAWFEKFGPLPEGVVPVAWGSFCGGITEKLFGCEPLVMKNPSNEGLVEALRELKGGLPRG